MNPFWQTLVAVLGGLAAVGSALGGVYVARRGKRTTFTANIWRRLNEVESKSEAALARSDAALDKEKLERQQETAGFERQLAAFRAALQQFRNRDGIWLELWHDSNIERAAAGLPVVQLPEALRKWPEEIASIL